MRAYLPVLTLVLLASASSAAIDKAEPYNGCDTPDATLRAQPSGAGPARLERVVCPPAGVVPSPDGQRFLGHRSPYYDYRLSKRLYVSGREKTSLVMSYPFDALFLDFRRKGYLFHWASDSRSIWGADQPKTNPNGWAAGPLTPFVIGPSGVPQKLTLVSDAGALDGLLWIGGEGLALAQFGTRGDYYRPPHPDANPTLAFVDVKHGRILNSLALKDFPKAVGGVGGPMVPLQFASMLMPDGRPRVLLQWPSGYSLLWTQGSSPREIRLPNLPWGASMTLAPDGKRLLIAYPLSATGAICEETDGKPDPCPPPRPTTGKLLELIDIETGTTLWEMRDRSEEFEGYPEPAISPEGRYALIGIPRNHGANIALISLENGQILQTMRSLQRDFQATFGADRRFFVSSGAYVAVYEIEDR